MYYMYTESDEETEGWIQAIKDEMIAMVDPEQKHYFSLDQMRAVNRSDSTTCAIDTSAFDDVSEFHTVHPPDSVFYPTQVPPGDM